MSATRLVPADFASFFEAIWGVAPFPWQERLLMRLVTGEDPHHGYTGNPGLWPDVLDLPTGSGKTAALDIALFHLALESTRGVMRRAPTRVAFVVDRRLVVDDVFQRASALARKLRAALNAPSTADPTVLKVARCATSPGRVIRCWSVRCVAERPLKTTGLELRCSPRSSVRRLTRLVPASCSAATA
jgi:CRISPR-associated endonuclease/helicase Cas3